MKKSAENSKTKIDEYIDQKSKNNYSGTLVIVVNMHIGGVTKVDILGNRESLKLKE
jgi:hypothetical protein